MAFSLIESSTVLECYKKSLFALKMALRARWDRESSVTFSSNYEHHIYSRSSLILKIMSSQSNTFSAHQQNALEKEGNKSDYPHANQIQSYATSEADSEDEFHDCEEVDDSDTQVISFFCLSDSNRPSSHDSPFWLFASLKHLVIFPTIQINITQTSVTSHKEIK